MTASPRSVREPAPGSVVITGASSGIGRAAAREFASRGRNLVLAARDPGSLEEAAREAKARGAGSVAAVPTDVSDPAAIEHLGRAAADQGGGIDVWVNDAAVMAYGTLEEIPREVYRRVIDVNLFGAIEGSRVALGHFRREGRGHLINVGSLYSRMTSPLVGPYVVSKFGLLGFSEVLRQETMDESDIHVTIVLPGSVDTPIFRHAANYSGRAARPVPPVSDVRRVGRAIADVVDRPRAKVVVGNTHRLLAWGKSAFPFLYDRLVPDVMVAAGLRPETTDEDEGNVFRSRPEWNRLHGSWTRRGDAAALGRVLRAGLSRAARRARPLVGRT
ncbi:MAG: SDR family NAD(P)-dependent oxidoreductase, partial [Actinomycetota bacterium]